MKKISLLLFCFVFLLFCANCVGKNINTSNTVTATFIIDNKMEEITLEKGGVLREPNQPEKEGYQFICWITENEVKYNFDEKIFEDIFLIAKFSKKTNIYKTNNIVVEYNLKAYSYFELNEYVLNIFINLDELNCYFQSDSLFNISKLYFESITEFDFEKYYIVHYASILNSWNSVEIEVYESEQLEFHITEITYTNEFGYYEEGNTIESFFFLLEKEKIDSYSGYTHSVSNEMRIYEE